MSNNRRENGRGQHFAEANGAAANEDEGEVPLPVPLPLIGGREAYEGHIQQQQRQQQRGQPGQEFAPQGPEGGDRDQGQMYQAQVQQIPTFRNHMNHFQEHQHQHQHPFQGQGQGQLPPGQGFPLGVPEHGGMSVHYPPRQAQAQAHPGVLLQPHQPHPNLYHPNLQFLQGHGPLARTHVPGGGNGLQFHPFVMNQFNPYANVNLALNLGNLQNLQQFQQPQQIQQRQLLALQQLQQLQQQRQRQIPREAPPPLQVPPVEDVVPPMPVLPAPPSERRMTLTNVETRWALAIQAALQDDPELDPVSDFMVAQYAIVCRDNVAWAVKRAKHLQVFREEVEIADTLQEAKKAFHSFFYDLFPGFFLSFSYYQRPSEEEDNDNDNDPMDNNVPDNDHHDPGHPPQQQQHQHQQHPQQNDDDIDNGDNDNGDNVDDDDDDGVHNDTNNHAATGSYVMMYDLAAFPGHTFKHNPHAAPILFKTCYYMLHCMCPDFDAIRRGIIFICEAEGFDWRKNVDINSLRRAWQEILVPYPMGFQKIKYFHTGMFINLINSLKKRFLPRRITEKVETGCRLDDATSATAADGTGGSGAPPRRLSDVYLQPDLETANIRLVGRLEACLQARLENEKTFRLVPPPISVSAP